MNPLGHLVVGFPLVGQGHVVHDGSLAKEPLLGKLPCAPLKSIVQSVDTLIIVINKPANSSVHWVNPRDALPVDRVAVWLFDGEQGLWPCWALGMTEGDHDGR